MRNTDELLANLFAVALHELLAKDPDLPTLIVLERLGLAYLTKDTDGMLRWRATPALIGLARRQELSEAVWRSVKKLPNPTESDSA